MKKEYCDKCGRQLVKQQPITADNFGWGGNPYDKKTGKLRMINWVACPMYLNWWRKFSITNAEHNFHAVGDEWLTTKE